MCAHVHVVQLHSPSVMVVWCHSLRCVPLVHYRPRCGIQCWQREWSQRLTDKLCPLFCIPGFT